MFLAISAPMKFKFLMHARFIDLEKREKLSGQLLHLLRGGSCLQTNSCAASQEGGCLQTNSRAASQDSSCLQTNSCAGSQSSSCLAGNYQLLYLYRVCQREITDGGGFRVGLCFVFILGDVLGYFRPDEV